MKTQVNKVNFDWDETEETGDSQNLSQQGGNLQMAIKKQDE